MASDNWFIFSCRTCLSYCHEIKQHVASRDRVLSFSIVDTRGYFLYQLQADVHVGSNSDSLNNWIPHSPQEELDGVSYCLQFDLIPGMWASAEWSARQQYSVYASQLKKYFFPKINLFKWTNFVHFMCSDLHYEDSLEVWK